MTADTAPARSEALSPFLPWRDEERCLPGERDDSSEPLVIQLLQSPDAILERITDPARVQDTVLSSIAIIAAAGALAALIMLSGWQGTRLELLLNAAMVSVGLLGALAATIVPVYGAGILHSARMPIGQLVAVLTTSVATASLLLVALAALPCLLWRLDPVWAGPLALVAAFFGAAAGCGLRFRAQLCGLMERALPEDAAARYAPDAQLATQRVQAFARIAMFLLGFTNALAGWAWLAVC